MLCKYGCGNKAIYQDRCNKNYIRCPINRKKASDRAKEAHRIKGKKWYKENHKAWNIGLTKETDSRIAKYSNTFKENIKSGKTKTNKGIKLSENGKKNISLGMQKAVREGRHVTARPGGICKIFKRKDSSGKEVHIQGSWEMKFVEFLDSKKIYWTRNKIGFKYIFEFKERIYFPDFYLKDYDQYIEVKGYETEKDREKWKQFPFDLITVKEKEIHNLDKWYESAPFAPVG